MFHQKANCFLKQNNLYDAKSFQALQKSSAAS